MDLSRIISDQSARQVEKQALYIRQFFNSNSDLSDIFVHIATEEPELCQQILSKSEACIKNWFLIPEDYLQAIQSLALLAPLYGPEPQPEALSKTWLLPAVRCCLSGMEHAFHLNTENAARKIATHLLNLNPTFTQCENLKQTRKLLHIMFADEELHWSKFAKCRLYDD